MKMSSEGLMALMHSEGIVLSRYKDSVGVWTIGIGHTKHAGRPPNPDEFTGNLKLSEAVDLLRDDIEGFAEFVSLVVEVPLKQCEFDSLVHFHYNTGQLGRSNLLNRYINNGDKSPESIRKGFMGWTKPPEIVPRRELEIAMFFGTYPPETAMIYDATPHGRVLWSMGREINTRELLETGKAEINENHQMPVWRENRRSLQEWCNAHGATLLIDGIWGSKSRAALKEICGLES